MNIHIKATHITLTPEITEYLDKRIGTLDKLIDEKDLGSVLCNAELAKITNHHKQGDVFKAEINLRVAGKYFYATGEKETLNAAIDKVKDEIAAELKSYKTKRQTLIKRGGAKIKNMIKGVFGK